MFNHITFDTHMPITFKVKIACFYSHFKKIQIEWNPGGCFFPGFFILISSLILKGMSYGPSTVIRFHCERQKLPDSSQASNLVVLLFDGQSFFHSIKTHQEGFFNINMGIPFEFSFENNVPQTSKLPKGGLNCDNRRLISLHDWSEWNSWPRETLGEVPARPA